MKKTTLISLIICLALLPLVFGNLEPFDLNLPQIEVTDTESTDKHKVGTEQGKGDAKPFEVVENNTNNPNADVQNNGLTKPENTTDNKSLADYPIVVFIVSTEKTGEISSLNSTAIICYTMPIGNENYLWRGGNRSWSHNVNLHYFVQAYGNKNGITSVKATEHLDDEKTDTKVYVRQIVGVTAKIETRSELYG